MLYKRNFSIFLVGVVTIQERLLLVPVGYLDIIEALVSDATNNILFLLEANHS